MKPKVVFSLFMCSTAIAVRAGADDPQPPPRPEPPAEAFEACAKANQGDACTVNFRNHTVKGVCVTFSDNRLGCRPSERPPPPQEA